MTKEPIFTLFISKDLIDEDRELLLNAIKPIVDVNQPTQHQFAPEWELFVALTKDIGVIAGVATALLKLANEINKWRENVRKTGRKPKVKLHRPNKPALNLDNATEDEIHEWFSVEKNQPENERK